MKRWLRDWLDTYGDIIGVVLFALLIGGLIAIAAWFDGFARGLQP